MLLADFLPQSNSVQLPNNMAEAGQNNEFEKSSEISSSEVKPIEDEPYSISSIKIPLVSFQPILATSPEFLLVNENTKRRNTFIIFDQNFQKFEKRSFIKEPLLDGLWYEDEKKFLLLTATNISALDPMTGYIELVQTLIPTDNKYFKCFTFLNQSILLIAYEEWGADYIDQWKQDKENGSWKLIGKLPVNLTYNEFIGSMLTIIENNCSYVALTIYNHLTEQWRLELRHTETFICQKEVLLPDTNVAHDYRIISIENTKSDVKFLVFSSMNSNIIAIDSQWKKTQLNYKHPVQRMALFQGNQLIVRTTERVDIHLFL
ncbi:hypothetical protein I4U23_008009 [Adineta vaga]|nr:hypothetical protein I4U23_008009 [Adineta vaga]